MKNKSPPNQAALIAELGKTLKAFIDSDGYTSYVDDAEKESSIHIIEGRKLIAAIPEQHRND
jgi:hypothetical protein